MGATLTRAVTAPGTDGGGAGSNRVFNEVPSGAIPGTGSFTTAADFTDGSEALYLNGQRQQRGTCYTTSESGGIGTGFDTVSFAFTLHASDTVTVDYTPA